MAITSIKRLSAATAFVAAIAFTTVASAGPRWSENDAVGAAAATAASPYYGYYNYAPAYPAGALSPEPLYDMTPGWWNGWYGQPYPPGCGAGRPHC